MNALGPQRIVVAIVILVIAGVAGSLLANSDAEDQTAAPVTQPGTDTDADEDPLIGVTTPPAEFSIWDVLTSGDTDRFAALAETAGARRDLESLVDADRVTLERTVFAPTDAAVEAFGEAFDVPGRAVLITGFHTIDGQRLRANDLLNLDGQTVTTLIGEPLSISVVDGEVVLNSSARIVSSNMTDNGVLHVIDAVLEPPS